MSPSDSTAPSGLAEAPINFDGIGIVRLTFTEVPVTEAPEPGGQVSLAAGGSLRYVENGKAEVQLDFRVGPHPKRPYLIEVSVVARFRSELPEEEFHQFCGSQAPAIMFPYVRQYINTISSMGRSGGIVLPLMNTQMIFPPNSWNTEPEQVSD